MSRPSLAKKSTLLPGFTFPEHGHPMYPNAERYNPDTEYANKLVDRIGQTPAWIALRIGITEKRMRYILTGARTIKGDSTEIFMTYAEQFCMECLAVEAKAAKDRAKSKELAAAAKAP